jgi:hypothetical protein
MKSTKQRAILLSVVLGALVGGLAAASSANGDWNGGWNGGWNGNGNGNGNGNKPDFDKISNGANQFALFDGSNPLNQPNAGALCGARKGTAFTYHLAVANYGSDGFVRVTYADGDWIQFPILAQGSFSMSQAAGSRSGDDAAVRVSNGGSAAQLAGALSAQGGRCASCDADGGVGDVGCDKFVPN